VDAIKSALHPKAHAEYNEGVVYGATDSPVGGDTSTSLHKRPQRSRIGHDRPIGPIFLEIMANSKRNRRAKNKIEGSSEGALIKADPSSEPAIVINRSDVVRAARITRLSAELEEVIEIIARERVYRAMLARNRRLLAAPKPDGEEGM
jgi:hypothetical protein